MAIISVVIFHVMTRYESQELDAVARFFRRFGLLGVDIFFPLSGFLITGYLIRRNDPGSLKIFFMRRFYRIVPLYMAATTIYFCIFQFALNDEAKVSGIWKVYTLLTGWFLFFGGEESVPYTITWSISVEEFAYILFGLSALIFKRRFLYIIATLAALSMLLRLCINMYDLGYGYYFPPARVDSIAIGGLCAFFYLKNKYLATAVFAALSMVFLVVFLNYPELRLTFKYTLISFATCTVICIFASLKDKGYGFFISLLSQIGFYSYFTYLFHLFNIEAILLVSTRIDLGVFGEPWGVSALALFLTHVQAMVSYHVFEGPIMRFGRSRE